MTTPQFALAAPAVRGMLVLTPAMVNQEAAAMEARAKREQGIRLRWYGAAGVAAFVGAAYVYWRKRG